MRQDDMLKLLSLIFSKIYKRLIKNNVSNSKTSKEPIKPENHPIILGASDMSKYQNICINETHNP